ncbi:hypothetical protein [Jannaschia seohaensis]|uniref:Methanogenic corrinoid protein MtbC1 n=1 Tax=Jannaschia seohaensis TaxID=475081 RepID=A0A2Y9A393_9RHOB|nr:hypothetical protein [Jannaschia seohaensis]PWJ21710.1 hypothetical protein BCF38_101118 [Jannaschia seohaensis]SSA37988.1 hypothetical protein SAMN05421539_101118 [Jannaschia seohaensis]
MSKTRLAIQSLPEAVAASVLTQQADRFADLMGRAGADPTLIDAFTPMAERIFLHPDETPRRTLLAAGEANARLGETLLGAIFPRVAALLEEGWNTDRLSFVDVTIAATRLQDAVRQLGRFVLPVQADALVMIVPPWEQHGLPPSLAASRLRRMGMPTRLVSGLPARQMLALIARTGPSGVLISVGSHRSAAKLRPLIGALRHQLQRVLPIVVGGPAMEADSALCRLSGADLATNDLAEALSFCDLALGSKALHQADVDA